MLDSLVKLITMSQLTEYLGPAIRIHYLTSLKYLFRTCQHITIHFKTHVTLFSYECYQLIRIQQVLSLSCLIQNLTVSSLYWVISIWVLPVPSTDLEGNNLLMLISKANHRQVLVFLPIPFWVAILFPPQSV